MDIDTSMKRYATFVVRLLLDEERRSLIEGQIRHVGTKEAIYFRDLNKVIPFIEAHLEDACRDENECS